MAMIPLDVNHDGQVDFADLKAAKIKPGSPEAREWWERVEKHATNTRIPAEVKAKYGSKVIGMYKGKPLVPGEAGKGQGDFEFMVDKLKATRGMSDESARNVAGKIRWKLYGGE